MQINQTGSQLKWRTRTRVVADIFVTVCAAIVILGYPSATGYAQVHAVISAPVPGSITAQITTEKARYDPGEIVNFQIIVVNRTDRTVTGDVSVAISHLGERMSDQSVGVASLAPNCSQTFVLSWRPPRWDYQGYLVEGKFTEPNGTIVAQFDTAVDVSSDWSRFPRYGFLSEYPQMSPANVHAELAMLNTYHINGLQFYDWQWMHHVPLAGTLAHPAASWKDIAGRMTYGKTIRDFIDTGHQFGMASMNYNLLYGAWDGYQVDKSGVQPAWGLYSDMGGLAQVRYPMPSGWNATGIQVFNPANSGWQRYLFTQEERVFDAYPFDGWQVDQLGDLGTTYDSHGNFVDLQATFAPFLNRAAHALGREVVFNNVGGYGLLPVVQNSSESTAYVECWPQSGQVTYDDLRNVVDSVNTFSHGEKATVLAAYLDSDYANSFSATAPGYFNTPGVLLADASIFASGGDHIELGDNLQMLNAPYFPNHNLLMTADLKSRLLSYYNFLVAYENVLRGTGASQRPATADEGAGSVPAATGVADNNGTALIPLHNRIILKDIATSDNGMARTVWTYAKRSKEYDVMHLINLYGQATSSWQDSFATKKAPPVLKNIRVKYYVGNVAVQSLFVASPDIDGGSAISLSFHRGHDAEGSYVSFTVPRLAYWDMVVMRHE